MDRAMREPARRESDQISCVYSRGLAPTSYLRLRALHRDVALIVRAFDALLDSLQSHNALLVPS